MTKNSTISKIPFVWIIGIMALMFFVAVPGCGTLTILLGDPIRYSLSGSVRQAGDMNEPSGGNVAISNVEAAISCKRIESFLWQNRKGLTDDNGQYRLEGYGILEECSISFNHKDYQPTTIVINKSHLVRGEGGLSPIYEVNVQLIRRIRDQ